jgi:hypothetical protein
MHETFWPIAVDIILSLIQVLVMHGVGVGDRTIVAADAGEARNLAFGVIADLSVKCPGEQGRRLGAVAVASVLDHCVGIGLHRSHVVERVGSGR